ncbi:MAG: glycosyltransferase family 2 protein [Pirellulales bacterium]|nr:glycosyltransferase family 2 protein [Pirellulales bacterium]
MNTPDSHTRPQAGGLLSIVIPCHNEAEVIRSTHRRLQQVLSACEIDYEVIYVDDGSCDRTLSELERIATADPHVTVIELSRNFGQQAAMSVGLSEAHGDATVILDADLQDPPEVIPQMLTRWRQGADVVYGQRRSRDGETAFKLITASLFHRLFRKLVPYRMPVDTGDFKLLDRAVVEAICQLPEKRRYMRTLVAWSGFKQEPVLYDREARSAGETKYSPFKLIRLAADAVVISSDTPLRLVWAAAGLLTLVAGVAGISAIFAGSAITGLFAGISFVGSVQVAATAMVGEYAVRGYREAQGRPTAITRRLLSSRTAEAGLRQPSGSASDANDGASSSAHHIGHRPAA